MITTTSPESEAWTFPVNAEKAVWSVVTLSVLSSVLVSVSVSVPLSVLLSDSMMVAEVEEVEPESQDEPRSMKLRGIVYKMEVWIVFFIS